MYMYHNFLIHSSVNGHLGCFLAFVNSAAMNTGVHVSKFSVHCFDILKNLSGWGETALCLIWPLL